MKTTILAFILALPLVAFAQKPELKLISQTEKSETVTREDGTTENLKVIVLKMKAEGGTLGPVHLKVEVKSPQGAILTDVMPSFGYSDDKEGRTVHLYIKEKDIKKHVGAVFSAEVSSKGFSPIPIQYQFKEE